MKNQGTFLGFMVLFGLWMVYAYLSQPGQAEIDKWEAQVQHYYDSLREDSTRRAKLDSTERAKLAQLTSDSTLNSSQRDSILRAQAIEQKSSAYGIFTEAAVDSQAREIVLENEQLRLTFTSKGARIVRAEIKGYQGYDQKSEHKSGKLPVELMNQANDRFDYLIPMTNVERGSISTRDLNFSAVSDGKSVTFRAYTNDSTGYIEQKYSLTERYVLDYNLTLQGIQKSMPRNAALVLNWDSYLNKIEKNDSYERTMSSLHYKEADDSPSYCNCAADANDQIGTPLQWVSHSQQFFNVTLIAEGQPFQNAQLRTVMTHPAYDHLKELYSVVTLPFIDQPTAVYDMKMYIGPSDYDELATLNVQAERIIPFGWSIFGAINRYAVRPLFNFFADFIPNYGIIILLLTLLIRLIVYPLQRKMLVSSVKMGILRPEIDKLRERYKNDPQSMQLEQMKMLQQYGVNPLGGCLPMLLTMPIWIALYRFFPSSIEFRQQGFLWADDLVSYDSVLDFGFYIPLYGDHFSLFTFLWMISMFAFLYYNSKQMDMTQMQGAGANMKVMKFMQYAFPVIFFFALNSWASGLTVYMLLSNLLNIFQTYVTKNFLINKEKLREQMEATMEANKNNPKGGGMWEQYEKMMRQQQEARQKKGK